MVPHEEARDTGMLRFCDTTEDVLSFAGRHPTAFISHQWLAPDAPDPDGTHFRAICAAVAALCKKLVFTPAEVYLWIDYSSVPQRNLNTQQACIGSLGLYASVARFFVAVAPEVPNRSGASCDLNSYVARGWCRLEQWARLTVGGLDGVYLYDGHGLHEYRAGSELMQQMLGAATDVFGGDFTVEKDRETLVDTVIGLWALTLVNRDTPYVRDIHNLVSAKKAAAFPVELFGDMIDRLENDYNQVLQLRASAIGSYLQDAPVSQPKKLRELHNLFSLTRTFVVKLRKRTSAHRLPESADDLRGIDIQNQ